MFMSKIEEMVTALTAWVTEWVGEGQISSERSFASERKICYTYYTVCPIDLDQIYKFIQNGTRLLGQTVSFSSFYV